MWIGSQTCVRISEAPLYWDLKPLFQSHKCRLTAKLYASCSSLFRLSHMSSISFSSWCNLSILSRTSWAFGSLLSTLTPRASISSNLNKIILINYFLYNSMFLILSSCSVSNIIRNDEDVNFLLKSFSLCCTGIEQTTELFRHIFYWMNRFNSAQAIIWLAWYYGGGIFNHCQSIGTKHHAHIQQGMNQLQHWYWTWRNL